MSWSDRKVVFVPGCVLCPAFQADFADKNLVWQRNIIDFLVDKYLGIYQMPCPEASFGSYKEGILRGKHGINYYEKLPNFSQHCKRLGQEVVSEIRKLTVAEYVIVAIIGIEHSPTCAASYMRTSHGMEKRKGIYISAIEEGIVQENLDIPIIGINRRYPDKFMRNMSQLLESKEKV